MVGLAGADIPLALAMTVVTTLLLPLSLPLVVKILVGREIHFDLFGWPDFWRPWSRAVVERDAFPALPEAVGLARGAPYPISLVLFAAVNLGAFGLYVLFLGAHRAKVPLRCWWASVWGRFWRAPACSCLVLSPPSERMAAAGGPGLINNVLVIVIGSYFSDPLTSVMAALYLIPYYALVIPLSHLVQTLRPRRDTGNLKQPY